MLRRDCSRPPRILEKLAQFDEPDIPALKGWRRQLFGEKALALRSGKLALGIKNKEVAAFPLYEAKP